MSTYRFNNLPMLTWNKLRMNHTDLELPEYFHEAKVSVLSENLGGEISVSEKNKIESISTGMGEAMTNLVKNSGVKSRDLTADGEKEARVKLKIKRESTGLDILNVNIYARAKSRMTVWMDYSSLKGTKGALGISTRVYLESGADVKLVQLGLSDEEDILLNDIGVVAEENAGFEAVQLLLGGNKVFAGCKADLVGKHSKMETSVGYYGRKRQQIDMNYVADHRGVASESRMYASGVLDDRSTKLFRGTINFVRGAAESIGDESEEVLLLSDGIVNQTIPLILCGEEDVAGNHGATIGKLDEEMLFYLKSRGFSDLEATIMVAKARIDAIGEKLDDESLKEALDNYLEVMFDEQRNK